MDEKVKYRLEKKYFCDEGQLVNLDVRLKRFLKPDAYQVDVGFYTVRSVYFDDMTDTCAHETLQGVSKRKKYRLRIYNGNADVIKLEIKHKLNGYNYKETCRISKNQCETLLAGKLLPINPSDPKALTKFNIDMRVKLLRAKVIVEYRRKAYINKLGNARITFDTNLSYSNKTKAFLEPVLVTHRVRLDKQLLEVKYDEFLLDSINDLLQLDTLQVTAFSKYVICRGIV